MEPLRQHRFPTKEELEKIKKASEAYKIKMGWSKPEKPLPSLTEEEFMGKLNEWDLYLKTIIRRSIMQMLIDRVLEQIKVDIEGGDLTALEELIKVIDKHNLIQYLPEEEWSQYETCNAEDFIEKI